MRTLEAFSTLLGGRYIVRECLGQGGWGAVYEATQTNLGRTVAIKVLHPELALSPDRMARFAFEAKAAAALGHPNIVQVTDFQGEPGQPAFLVMERLQGATLAKALGEKERMAGPRVAWIAHQVLSALEAAHEGGLIHRDVKPENVFLVSAAGVDDHVKLLDFGIAKLVDGGSNQVTTEGALLGSPAFMAPEQIKGEELDRRVDLYALGATMYRALAGALPFEGPTVHSLMFAIASTPLRPLREREPSIDPALAAIVERAMAKAPADRFASAAEMRAALKPWVEKRASAADAPVRTASLPAIERPQQTTGARGVTEPMPAASMTQAVAVTAVMPRPESSTPAPAPPRSRMPLIAGGIVASLLAAVALFFGIRANDTPAAAPPDAGVTAVNTATAVTSVAAGPTPAISADAPKTAAAVSGRKPAASSTVAVTTLPTTPSPTPTPASGARFGGRTARMTGGSFGDLTEEQVRTGLVPATAAINACYADTESEPPDHQRMGWTVAFDASGAAVAVHPATPFGRHAKLDACMTSALRGAKVSGATKRVEARMDFVSAL